ncbi:MAG: hypothetical protein H6Q96_453 [Nitrospirae bacterium]|jgi:hypothetical protein|nr:hypothetical protein [Nitrospirota bacterium]
MAGPLRIQYDAAEYYVTCRAMNDVKFSRTTATGKRHAERRIV